MISARDLELLAALVAKEFKVRYKSTALGFLWSLAHPLFFAAVLYVAFQNVVQVPTQNYLAFLLAGLFPWQWFANTALTSPRVFLINVALIKKARVSRVLLPAALVANHLVHFCLALAVAIPVLVVSGIRPSWNWLPGIPALLVVQALLCVGVACALSSLNVFFRDLEHLSLVGTNLLFFLTPIVYLPEAIPDRYRWMLPLNPLYYVVPSWRSLMLDGTLEWTSVGLGAAYAAAVFLAGVAVLRAVEKRFVEFL